MNWRGTLTLRGKRTGLFTTTARRPIELERVLPTKMHCGSATGL